jgi:hypothetical protein
MVVRAMRRSRSAGRRRPHDGHGRDTGAAAVEFALVSPILLLLLFGIIDYGIWFADSLSMKDSLRGHVRQAVVGNFGTACAAQPLLPGTVSPQIQKLACNAARGARPISGNVYVKIDVIPTSGGVPLVGSTLRVCALQKHAALLPLIPVPNGGVQTAQVEMPLEADPQTVITGTVLGGAQTLPAGLDWSSCS